MKITLDQTACIGCGLCVQTSPENFSMNESTGTAKLLRDESSDDSVNDAREGCPVGCIYVE